jgi:hypothetical protein
MVAEIMNCSELFSQPTVSMGCLALKRVRRTIGGGRQGARDITLVRSLPSSRVSEAVRAALVPTHTIDHLAP